MDRLVRRIIKVQKSGNVSDASVVYERDDADDDDSALLRPAEKASRHVLEAEHAFAAEALRLHDKSVRDGEESWLVDGPANFAKAQRKAYNVMRKTAPFGFIPRPPKL